MKKLLGRMMAFLFVLGMLNGAYAQGKHEHAPMGGWDRNAQEHWRACECGEKIDAQAHVMDDIYCTVCGSEIWLEEDGSASIYDYDENGYMSRYSFCDGEGILIEDYLYVREYDLENGMMAEKNYYAGMEWENQGYALIGEAVYRIVEEDWYIPVRQMSYYPEGQMEGLNEYDEYGNVVIMLSYDEAGMLIFEENTEYVYTEEGEILQTTQRGRFDDGEAYVNVYNEYADQVISSFYDADGNVMYEFRTEYSYDESGLRLASKHYYDGQLQRECTYVVTEDDYGAWSRLAVETEYYEDGSRSVCEYDEAEWPVKGTDYDAEGNVVRVYTYDEEGNVVE